jgi:hypothetical protein|eukprot:COSAG02_NODE_362_length_23815_cov_27.096981_12_plen_69_part_00
MIYGCGVLIGGFSQVYLDMVHQVDTELGDLLAAIDNNTNAPGLKERTAFFVSSGGFPHVCLEPARHMA